MKLRHDRDVGARVVRLDRGSHACATTADHENLVLSVHVREPT
jgi:hypothetical protein